MASQKPQIYFDNHATTPVDPRVLDAMLPFLKENFGNPESTHAFGWQAKLAVDQARAEIASLINAEPSEIIFTSGATESTALAIKGYLASEGSGGKLFFGATDHKATLEVAHELKATGREIIELSVDPHGLIQAKDIEKQIDDKTKLVSLVHGNNEIGTIHPLREIGELLKSRGIAFHVDAVQTLGRAPIDVKAMGIDLMSLSGHKIYGPKGVGALFIRRGIRIQPLFSGGGQEHGLRGGTLNVPGIAGFGKASAIAKSEMANEVLRLTKLRDLVIGAVVGKIPDVFLNGHPSQRLCHNINLQIEKIDVDQLHLELGEFVFSAGSACTGLSPSHVIAAIGRKASTSAATVRFGLGRFNSDAEVQKLIARLPEAIQKSREIFNSYNI